VVRGNHDNYLATIASKLGVEMVDELEIGGIWFAHGHLPNRHRPLVLGHEHPSVRLFDSVGACVKMPCFVHLPRERILVMPAFSPLASGTDYTGLGKGGAFSPILAEVDMSEARAYGCSEIGLLSLGLISELTRSRQRV
jgi:putative SbcD/Mre11-related phosphoesterase